MIQQTQLMSTNFIEVLLRMDKKVHFNERSFDNKEKGRMGTIMTINFNLVFPKLFQLASILHNLMNSKDSLKKGSP